MQIAVVNQFSPLPGDAVLPLPFREGGRGVRYPYAGTRSMTSRGSVMRPVMAEAIATAGFAR